MVAEVLTRTVAILRLRVMLYKAVVQKVLLCERERESWVVTGAMLKLLVGFHHRVVIWIAGNTDRSTVGGGVGVSPSGRRPGYIRDVDHQ